MKKQVILQQNYLSDDLIIDEILTRLPVKSILRFKSVSKQWYSTLSSSDFAKAHLMKSPLAYPSAPLNTLFIKCRQDYYLFSYDDDDQISGNFEDNLVKLYLDFDFGDILNVQLTGSCNGLICLTPVYVEYFILWNPATRKLHKFGSDGCSKLRPSCFVAHGFGYAYSVDDYKFVRITSEPGVGSITAIIHVFSCRENKWRQIDFGHGYLPFNGQALLISEKLYWRAGNSVVSFDLGVERFEIIEFDVGCFDCIGVMGGALSKCYSGSKNRSDNLIHILESPTIVKSIELPKELKLNIFSEMIGFTGTGKFFVTASVHDNDDVGMHGWPMIRIPHHRATLGLVDTLTKPMLYVTLVTFNQSITIARYIPSLVSPFPSEELLDA